MPSHCHLSGLFAVFCYLSGWVFLPFLVSFCVFLPYFRPTFPYNSGSLSAISLPFSGSFCHLFAVFSGLFAIFLISFQIFFPSLCIFPGLFADLSLSSWIFLPSFLQSFKYRFGSFCHLLGLLNIAPGLFAISLPFSGPFFRLFGIFLGLFAVLLGSFWVLSYWVFWPSLCYLSGSWPSFFYLSRPFCHLFSNVLGLFAVSLPSFLDFCRLSLSFQVFLPSFCVFPFCSLKGLFAVRLCADLLCSMDFWSCF